MGRLAVQANDHIDTKQEKLWVVQPTHETYLDQLVGRPLGPPLPPLPEAELPVVRQPVVRQPSHPVPLLSFHLQPDLNALTRTLSPQALRYVHLGIQIGQNLLN